MFGKYSDKPENAERALKAASGESLLLRMLLTIKYPTVSTSVRIPPIATMISRFRIKPQHLKITTVSSAAIARLVTGIRTLESTVPM